MDDAKVKTLMHEKVIDNRQLTMLETLQHLLESQRNGTNFDIAVGYFYISGALMIKEQISAFMKNGGEIRVLMGNETNNLTRDTLDVSEWEPEFSEKGEEFSQSDSSFLRDFKNWVSEGRVQVKVYTGEANYFHAKSYLFSDNSSGFSGRVIVGSSNFSKLGLEGNTELNTFSQDSYIALRNWYDTLWNSEEVSDYSAELIKTLDDKMPVNPDARLYKTPAETLLDLAKMYGEAYSDLPGDKIWEQLYEHQKIGVKTVESTLKRFGTAVLADGVGLGKTRTTAGIIKLISADDQRKILIIADKKLQVQWEEELAIMGIYSSQYDYMSREKFTSSTPRELEFYAENYSLIVIDEAHLGFKNQTTQAWQSMRFVAERSEFKVKGLLLTATPWNNKREDVVNLGILFMSPDKVPDDRQYKKYLAYGRKKATKAISSDDEAFAEFWMDVFLQRTRKTFGGSKSTYPVRTFPNDGSLIEYEPAKNRILAENFERISELYLPYMDPIRYFDEERNTLTSDRFKLLMLKRADSSWVAYLNTLEKMIGRETELLSDLSSIEKSISKAYSKKDRLKIYLADRYNIEDYLGGAGVFDDIENDQEVDIMSVQSKRAKLSYLNKIQKQIDAINGTQANSGINRMRQQAESDLKILKDIAFEVRQAYERRDEKMETIISAISEEVDQGRKVILISQFRDTAKYYFDVLKNSEFARVGLVTGMSEDIQSTVEGGMSKKDVLDRFSPISKNQRQYKGTDFELDVLVGTDTISTGQNLQDAAVLMNIDLPYNPMVLEQRIGRIDRPRLPDSEETIRIYTFLAAEAIETELKMTERLGIKMAGVMDDTQFDDVVLPEYKNFLKNAANGQSGVIKKMVDATIDATVPKGLMAAESHETEYTETTKWLYDLSMEPHDATKNPVLSNVSFSYTKNQDRQSIAVVRFNLNDVNGQRLDNKTELVDLAQGSSKKLIEAVTTLKEDVENSIYSTDELDEESADNLKELAFQVAENLLQESVSDYNAQQKQTNEVLGKVSNKTADKATGEIRSFVQKNSQFVMGKLEDLGYQPLIIQEITKKIAVMDPSDETWDIVVRIANDVKGFFEDLGNYMTELITYSSGGADTSVDSRIAVADESSVEILTMNVEITR